MIVLVQVGNLGSSVIDRLIRPLAQAGVCRVLLICRHPGPNIPQIEYYCPPKFIAKFAPIAVVHEFFTLIYLTFFKRPNCISGYHLFPHGVTAFIIAKLTRRPVIISLIAGPIEVENPLRGILRQTSPWVGKIFLKILDHSNAVITTGSFTRAFLIRQGLEESKIYPITGISPPNDCRVRFIELPKLYDVVSVARLSPEKHIEVLVRAVLKVRENYENIKACIVGDGPCRTELENLADELRLNNNIDFIGFKQDVAYYYNSSKIFVLTSEREGSPTTFLEAMMCGIPSVVSNCGDITDIARDGFNCLVIQKYDDYEGFARAIIRLLEDEELYRMLAQNALETAKALPIEKAIEAWQSLLDGLGIYK